MGKATGFLEYKRQLPGKRPVEERIKDYKEINTPFPESSLKEQGARCMNCGVPFSSTTPRARLCTMPWKKAAAALLPVWSSNPVS